MKHKAIVISLFLLFAFAALGQQSRQIKFLKARTIEYDNQIHMKAQAVGILQANMQKPDELDRLDL